MRNNCLIGVRIKNEIVGNHHSCVHENILPSSVLDIGANISLEDRPRRNKQVTISNGFFKGRKKFPRDLDSIRDQFNTNNLSSKSMD
jgi:hypothetical protein